MAIEKVNGYAKVESGLLRRLLAYPLMAVALHWMFQSLLYMDRTERRFKIMLDIILIAAHGVIFSMILPWPTAWVLACLAGHTLNFLCNGHLWGALKHYGFVNTPYDQFQGYVGGFKIRAGRAQSIEKIVICGSLARETWSDRSDLDVRMIRKPGFVNGVCACWFALCERSRALIARFPLDAYVLDNEASLSTLSSNEHSVTMEIDTMTLPIVEKHSRWQINPIRDSALTMLGEIALLLLCVIPGLFFSYQTLQEPWTMFRIARASLSVDAGHILSYVTSGAGYRSEHIGGDMIQVGLLSATNWPLEALGLVPIGALVLAILYYAIARQITVSRWSAISIMLFVSWYYPGLYSQFGTETYVWTNALFLTFLILLLYWINNKTIVLSLLLISIFVSTFLHYHTTPLWIIVALFSVIIILKIRDSKSASKNNVSWSLVLICAVIYFTFDTVIYGNGLARLRQESTNESLLQNFLSKIIAPLFVTTPVTLKPLEIAPINPRVATWSTLIILLTLTIPIAIWCLIKVYGAVTTRDIKALVSGKNDIFVWVTISVTIAHALIYSTYGSVSLRVVPLAFPLLLPIAAQSFKHFRKVELLLTSALAICAIVGFLSFAPTLLPDTIASETGISARLMKPSSKVLADANVYGSLLLKAVEQNNLLDFTWMDSNTYSSIIGRFPINWDDFAYVAVDKSGKPIISSSWVFLEPWDSHISEIKQNTQLDKIYDSDNLMLFQKNGSSLPVYKITDNDIAIHDNYKSIDIFRMFFVVIFLLIIPGVIFTFILHKNSLFKFSGFHTLIGLSIGLSIAFTTLIGYIVNFTSLGLQWLIPLCVAIPLLMLAVYLTVWRPRISIRVRWIIHGCAILITVLVWSTLAGQVAQARTQRHALFTEFFVTHSDMDQRAIAVNVINRLNQTEEFTIHVFIDSTIIQTIGPKKMTPNSSWVYDLDIPVSSTRSRITIELEKEGVVYRELQFSSDVVPSRK